jgi:hypothetical protein
MNPPLDGPNAALKISRRGENLGTENAFVVLAEVNGLVRQGRDIVSFCIGQPDFPTPSTSGGGCRGDPRRQARYAVGQDRRASRGRATWVHVANRHRAGRCGRRRRNKPLHRLV